MMTNGKHLINEELLCLIFSINSFIIVMPVTGQLTYSDKSVTGQFTCSIG